MKYVKGLINLLVSLIVSTIIIYAINIAAGFAGADYTFSHGGNICNLDIDGNTCE